MSKRDEWLEAYRHFLLNDPEMQAQIEHDARKVESGDFAPGELMSAAEFRKKYLDGESG